MSNYRRVFQENHSYFITMVTHQREPLLIDNIQALRYAFVLSQRKYHYSLDAIVILPEHLHMIITPKYAMEYPKIIAHIKRSFTYGITKRSKEEAKMRLSASSYKRGLAGIWQKRFYEHTIRDEKDWVEKMEYIQFNAVKHQLVEVWDRWQYSSFVAKS